MAWRNDHLFQLVHRDIPIWLPKPVSTTLKVVKTAISIMAKISLVLLKKEFHLKFEHNILNHGCRFCFVFNAQTVCMSSWCVWELITWPVLIISSLFIIMNHVEFSHFYKVWPQIWRSIFTTFEKVMYQSMLGQGGNKEVSFMAWFSIVQFKVDYILYFP